VDVTCPGCGASLEGIPQRTDAALDLVCPACGSALRIRTAAGTRQVVAAGAGLVDGDTAKDVGTLFQPATLVEPESAAPVSAAATLGAYFLVHGKGLEERIELAADRTTFGREADVRLLDPEVAPRQFRVEVLDRDVFLRDLESGRPTRLNGREVRFVELRPGDEIRVGATVLEFGIADHHARNEEVSS